MYGKLNYSDKKEIKNIDIYQARFFDKIYYKKGKKLRIKTSNTNVVIYDASVEKRDKITLILIPDNIAPSSITIYLEHIKQH